MKDDDLTKRLWEVIQAWREMNLRPAKEDQAWNELINLPEPDFDISHELAIGYEHDHMGCRLYVIDRNNMVRKSFKLRLGEEDEE